ncbi:MBL fold metallo-hydrolase [Opitutaceae bacterium TAV4]|nr:MBL fold metallo-hydrolase [Opitutaceae bacterium TAV4]RRJ99898.1 MBL fold metallo-hydrolase [Opitutaceae bacterium TAV3]
MTPTRLLLVSLFLSLATPALPSIPASDATRIRSLKITILSTMLADGRELGEWGFAALVEADGRRILFDTGAHPGLVLENARTLGIDLTDVPEVIITHNHWDHIGGLLTLRKSVLDKNAPGALARVHVGEGIFYPRTSGDDDTEDNTLIPIKPAYEKTGGVFIIHDKPVQLHPGIWLTGPVPRKYPERNWGSTGKVRTPAGTVEDNVPEDQALIFDTEQGLVALFGCGHAGVVNTLDYARSFIRPARIHALIGGIHVFAATDQTWEWTAEKLSVYGVDHYIGAHCTGIESVWRFRSNLGLDRKHAVVGAVGATFTLGQGINPRNIAK